VRTDRRRQMYDILEFAFSVVTFDRNRRTKYCCPKSPTIAKDWNQLHAYREGTERDGKEFISSISLYTLSMSIKAMIFTI